MTTGMCQVLRKKGRLGARREKGHHAEETMIMKMINK